MRRFVRSLGVAFLSIALTIALAACATINPTRTPAPTATSKPTPTPVPGPTLAAAPVLSVVALNIAFRPMSLDIPAGVPFVIQFRNADPDLVPHDIDIRRDVGADPLRNQEPILGGQHVDYQFDALPAGDYVFICEVHPIPAMTGKLRVR